jgi:hypothetical protein
MFKGAEPGDLLLLTMIIIFFEKPLDLGHPNLGLATKDALNLATNLPTYC